MYKNRKQDPLQGERCFGCRFCRWDEERREEVCWIKGCVEFSKYDEYQGLYDKHKRMWK